MLPLRKIRPQTNKERRTTNIYQMRRHRHLQTQPKKQQKIIILVVAFKKQQHPFTIFPISFVPALT
ncbi:15238_t:CDS:1, partial [Gigaspora rosea]